MSNYNIRWISLIIFYLDQGRCRCLIELRTKNWHWILDCSKLMPDLNLAKRHLLEVLFTVVVISFLGGRSWRPCLFCRTGDDMRNDIVVGKSGLILLLVEDSSLPVCYAVSTVNNYRRFEGFFVPSSLIQDSIRSFETSVSICLFTWCDIPQEFDFQQHNCENSKSHILPIFFITCHRIINI